MRARAVVALLIVACGSDASGDVGTDGGSSETSGESSGEASSEANSETSESSGAPTEGGTCPWEDDDECDPGTGICVFGTDLNDCMGGG